MRSLFLKIFLWFWATVILTGIALVLTFILQPAGAPGQWHAGLAETARVYGKAAVSELEHGGTTAVAAYLDDLDRNSHLQACLFTSNKVEIAGRSCATFNVLLERVAASDAPAFAMRYGIARVGLKIAGTSGTPYIFATELGAGPRAGARPNLAGLALRWAVAFLVSGLICYLLTRHLTTPIFELRGAARQLALGQLTSRVAHGADNRHDELGELARDFNAMAEHLEQLISSQRQLISDVSHELRSPLARLTVALDLARERKGDDPAFHRMEKDFERLSEMLGRLLTVARLDSTSARPEMATVNLSVLVAEIVGDAQFEARERDRNVQLSNEEEIHIRGNGDLLRSAFENIIRNASRYTVPNSTVQVRLEWEPGSNSAMVLLTVRDYGPGVPESELTNIFLPFYRVAGARDRNSGGTGLGLAIADRVARLHGGSVMATNAAGGGLEVRVRIPAACT
jgi:two-component system sensor histidine kinase CpxA